MTATSGQGTGLPLSRVRYWTAWRSGTRRHDACRVSLARTGQINEVLTCAMRTEWVDVFEHAHVVARARTLLASIADEPTGAQGAAAAAR